MPTSRGLGFGFSLFLILAIDCTDSFHTEWTPPLGHATPWSPSPASANCQIRGAEFAIPKPLDQRDAEGGWNGDAGGDFPSSPASSSLPEGHVRIIGGPETPATHVRDAALRGYRGALDAVYQTPHKARQVARGASLTLSRSRESIDKTISIAKQRLESSRTRVEGRVQGLMQTLPSGNELMEALERSNVSEALQRTRRTAEAAAQRAGKAVGGMGEAADGAVSRVNAARAVLAAWGMAVVVFARSVARLAVRLLLAGVAVRLSAADGGNDAPVVGGLRGALGWLGGMGRQKCDVAASSCGCGGDNEVKQLETERLRMRAEAAEAELKRSEERARHLAAQLAGARVSEAMRAEALEGLVRWMSSQGRI
eukprot:CAMPEP_0169475280 /NCGR_PEP_ID=MMETSP1042-20121227/26724_1 /TAXON_ID=464988 /ORGANISM="Hemiselmis andersenii, Strain CCMP1180" /LENGTH=367 /DNA_ID=CAMNT_0009589403 /DNA_START=52 /DNA_END=1153 /DNA_ORIENTATION=-